MSMISVIIKTTNNLIFIISILYESTYFHKFQKGFCKGYSRYTKISTKCLLVYRRLYILPISQ